jgi:hypothetical protein
MNGVPQASALCEIFHFVFAATWRRLFSAWNRHADRGGDHDSSNAIPENKRLRLFTPYDKIVSNFLRLIFPIALASTMVYSN